LFFCGERWLFVPFSSRFLLFFPWSLQKNFHIFSV
jgi:hypothetical protein